MYSLFIQKCSLRVIGVIGYSAGRCEDMEMNMTWVPADKKFIVFDRESPHLYVKS